MQKSYLIPILLLICSFVIYSYNLGEQPWYRLDEPLYLAWGGVYFDLIKKGDFNNPCTIGLHECELLYSEFRITETGERFYVSEVSYTLRNFFVGFGQYLTTGENKGHFYEWSCSEYPCYFTEPLPSRDEYYSGRFFSAIFGSLTVVVAFFIGKILFNRITGLFFSLILLFYSLWLVYSRLIMSEVYVHFFILLSILLLLQSFKKENNHRIPFFIFGAISFGIAINIKPVAIELVIPILIMILFYDSFNEKLNFRFFKNGKNVLKVISLVLIFFVISSVTFVATYPRYHDNILDDLLKNRDRLTVTGFTSLPTTEKNYLFQTLATLQVTLLPYLMDSYIHDVFSDEVGKTKLWMEKGLSGAQESPSNYSTIPLSLFFFIGLICLIRKIKNRNLKFSEFALLVWFTSLFIFTVLVVNEPTVERFYLPPMFPIILIASYALGKFIKQIQNQKEKILFFMLCIIAHSLYIISFFDKIYFSHTMWESPLPVWSQLSLNDPLVYLSSMIFVGISFLIYLRVKIRITAETS